MADIELDVKLNTEGLQESLGIFEQIDTEIKSIKKNLESATTQEEVKKWSAELGQAEAKMRDFNKQVEVAGRDTNIGQMSVLIGSLGDNLRRLDFGAAKKDLKEMIVLTNAMSLSLKNMTAASATEGLKNLAAGFKQAGTAALNFGRALLANPIGAFVVAVLAIVAALALLLKGFGLLKPVLDFVKGGFDSLIAGAKSLTDALNLTSFAYEDFLEKSVEAMEGAKQAHEQYRQEVEDFYTPRKTALENELALLEASGASEEEIYQKRKDIAVFEAGYAAQREAQAKNYLQDTQDRLLLIAKEAALEAVKQDRTLDLEKTTREYTTTFLTGTQAQITALGKKLKLDDEEIEKYKTLKTEYINSIGAFKAAQDARIKAGAQPGIVDAAELARQKAAAVAAAAEAKRRADEAAAKLQQSIAESTKIELDAAKKNAEAIYQTKKQGLETQLDAQQEVYKKQIKAGQDTTEQEKKIKETQTALAKLESEKQIAIIEDEIKIIRKAQQEEREKFTKEGNAAAMSLNAYERTLRQRKLAEQKKLSQEIIIIEEELFTEQEKNLEKWNKELEDSAKNEIVIAEDAYRDKKTLLNQYYKQGIITKKEYDDYLLNAERTLVNELQNIYGKINPKYLQMLQERTKVTGDVTIRGFKKRLDELSLAYNIGNQIMDEKFAALGTEILIAELGKRENLSYVSAGNRLFSMTEQEREQLRQSTEEYRKFEAKKLQIAGEYSLKGGVIRSSQASLALEREEKIYTKAAAKLDKELGKLVKDPKKLLARGGLLEEEFFDNYKELINKRSALDIKYFQRRKQLLDEGAQTDSNFLESIKQNQIKQVQEVLVLMSGFNSAFQELGDVRSQEDYNRTVRTRELESEAIQQRLYDLEEAGLQESSQYRDLTNQKAQIDRQAQVERNRLEEAAFKRNQSFAVANALIMGAQGIVAAYASMPSSPTATEIVLKTAQAALVATTTAIQIAKIKSTKFTAASLPAGSAPSAGVGGGGGGLGGGLNGGQPNFEFFGNQFGGNEGGATGGRQGAPGQTINVDVKISETEITSTQKRVMKASVGAEL